MSEPQTRKRERNNKNRVRAKEAGDEIQKEKALKPEGDSSKQGVSLCSIMCVEAIKSF